MTSARDYAIGWWEVLAGRCIRGDRVLTSRGPSRWIRRRLSLWPVTQVIHAGLLVEPLLPPGRRDSHAAVVDRLFDGLAWYRSGDAWGPRRGDRPRYADDVAWLGLASAARGRIRGEPVSDDVVAALRFVRSCEHPDGGVRWHDAATSRNTCSTAPAAHLALLLHRGTGDPDLLAFADRSLAWLAGTLRRPDGLYGDRVDEGEVVTTPWAYNTGEAALAWWLLGETGAAGASQEARRAGDALLSWLADDDVLGRHQQVFAGIGLRALAHVPGTGPRIAALLDEHLPRVAASGLAGDGFPTRGRPGRYGHGAVIELAGLTQLAAVRASIEIDADRLP